MLSIVITGLRFERSEYNSISMRMIKLLFRGGRYWSGLLLSPKFF